MTAALGAGVPLRDAQGDLNRAPTYQRVTADAGTTLRLRYCWPSELDLMARLAGLRLRERYQDWGRGPFTGESRDRISVYEVTAAPGG